MPYAETRLGLLAALLCAGGCASTPEPTPPPAAVAPAVQAAAPAPAPTPVSAAAQRAFDDARQALAAGRTAEAERAFTALTQSNPELGGPHAALGTMHLQAGRYDAAVQHLEAAVAANPAQPAYLNQLGVAYRHLGRFDKAGAAYEQAIALAPDHAAALLNLGILNDLYLGEHGRALELYERYLLLAPAGDATVVKWVADLKNRKPQTLAAKGQ